MMNEFEKQNKIQELMEAQPQLFEELVNEARDKVLNEQLEEIAQKIENSPVQDRLHAEFMKEWEAVKMKFGRGTPAESKLFTKYQNLGYIFKR